MKLSGVAKMIAEHSVPGTIAGGVLTLLLDQAHDTLLNEVQVQAIERAVNSTLDTPITLEIKPEILSVETPAARRERLQAKRQGDAERAMERDATVQALVADFEGTLEAVQPVGQANKEQL